MINRRWWNSRYLLSDSYHLEILIGFLFQSGVIKCKQKNNVDEITQHDYTHKAAVIIRYYFHEQQNL